MLNTEMNFEKIDNILISQNTPLSDLRPGFQYVNVVLYASSLSQTTPLIFRYLYKTRLKSSQGKNNLKHWLFVNRKDQEAQHMVQDFKTI